MMSVSITILLKDLSTLRAMVHLKVFIWRDSRVMVNFQNFLISQRIDSNSSPFQYTSFRKGTTVRTVLPETALTILMLDSDAIQN